jgi:hypothetical protein
MSGDIERLFQDGIDTGETWNGEEQRGSSRENTQLLSVEGRTLLKEIKKIIPERCGDNCNLGEFKHHVGHGIDIIKEKGGDSIKAGLTAFRDQDKQLEKIFSTRTKIIDKAIMVIAIALVVMGLKRLGWM